METTYRHSEVQMDRIVELTTLVSERNALRCSNSNDERELFYSATRELTELLNDFYEVQLWAQQ